MKKVLLYAFAALCGALMVPITASGQTYYDFALEELLGSSTNSIIRAVNPTEAVAYYETATDTRLVLVDINLNIKEISLPQNMYVRDIRVSGTNIY